MAYYKTIRMTNEEVGQELRTHIIRVYGGSIAAYCDAHNIDYSGIMKAIAGVREYSEQMVSPLCWNKKIERYFEKRLLVEDRT